MADQTTAVLKEIIVQALQHNANNYPNIVQSVDDIDDSSIGIITVDSIQKIVSIEDA